MNSLCMEQLKTLVETLCTTGHHFIFKDLDQQQIQTNCNETERIAILAASKYRFH